jgi:hypothetical protein
MSGQAFVKKKMSDLSPLEMLEDLLLICYRFVLGLLRKQSLSKECLTLFQSVKKVLWKEANRFKMCESKLANYTSNILSYPEQERSFCYL